MLVVAPQRVWNLSSLLNANELQTFLVHFDFSNLEWQEFQQALADELVAFRFHLVLIWWKETTERTTVVPTILAEARSSKSIVLPVIANCLCRPLLLYSLLTDSEEDAPLGFFGSPKALQPWTTMRSFLASKVHMGHGCLISIALVFFHDSER